MARVDFYSFNPLSGLLGASEASSGRQPSRPDPGEGDLPPDSGDLHAARALPGADQPQGGELASPAEDRGHLQHHGERERVRVGFYYCH